MGRFHFKWEIHSEDLAFRSQGRLQLDISIFYYFECRPDPNLNLLFTKFGHFFVTFAAGSQLKIPLAVNSWPFERSGGLPISLLPPKRNSSSTPHLFALLGIEIVSWCDELYQWHSITRSDNRSIVCGTRRCVCVKDHTYSVPGLIGFVFAPRERT